MAGELLVYPNRKVTLKVETEGLFDNAPGVARLTKSLAAKLSSLAGVEVDPVKGFEISRGLGNVKFKPPVISLGYEGEWKENEAAPFWKAHYDWKVSLAVEIKLVLEWDLFAASLAISGIGTGVLLFYSIIKEAIHADPPIYFSLEGSISGDSSMGHRENPYGAMALKGSGTATLGAKVDVNLVELSLAATTDIDFLTIEGEAALSGPELNYELMKWAGLNGKAIAKLKIGKFYSIGYEKSVSLLSESGPWSEGPLL